MHLEKSIKYFLSAFHDLLISVSEPKAVEGPER